MSIKWSDSMSVNVKLIDDQHKQFISILNSLYEAIADSETENKTREIINTLVEYTQKHFQTEGSLFDKYNYDGAEEHKLAHKALMDTVMNFQTKKGDYLTISFELADFLENWLVEHLEGMDKKYTKCLNESGLF